MCLSRAQAQAQAQARPSAQRAVDPACAWCQNTSAIAEARRGVLLPFSRLLLERERGELVCSLRHLGRASRTAERERERRVVCPCGEGWGRRRRRHLSRIPRGKRRSLRARGVLRAWTTPGARASAAASAFLKGGVHVFLYSKAERDSSFDIDIERERVTRRHGLFETSKVDALTTLLDRDTAPSPVVRVVFLFSLQNTHTHTHHRVVESETVDTRYFAEIRGHARCKL